MKYSYNVFREFIILLCKSYIYNYYLFINSIINYLNKKIETINLIIILHDKIFIIQITTYEQVSALFFILHQGEILFFLFVVEYIIINPII